MYLVEVNEVLPVTFQYSSNYYQKYLGSSEMTDGCFIRGKP